jgi:hypothetical protein
MNRIPILLAILLGLPCIASATPQFPYRIDTNPEIQQITAFDQFLVTWGYDSKCNWGMDLADFAGKLPLQRILQGDAATNVATSQNLVAFGLKDASGGIYIAYFDATSGAYGAVPPYAAQAGAVISWVDVWSPGDFRGSVFVWTEKGPTSEIQAYVWTPSWLRPQRIEQINPGNQITDIRAAEEYVAWEEFDGSKSSVVRYAPLQDLKSAVTLGEGTLIDILDQYIAWNENTASYNSVTTIGGGTIAVPPGGPCAYVAGEGRLARVGSDYWFFHGDVICGTPTVQTFTTDFINGKALLVDDIGFYMLVSESTGNLAYPRGNPRPGVCGGNDYDFLMVDFAP